MLKGITAAPPDAILGLTEAFKKDDRAEKINLGVGVYKDEEGKTPVLSSVRKAEERIVVENPSKSYMPISGSPEYGSHVRSLLFGSRAASTTARTLHTPGGTGALRVGADFLKGLRGGTRVWVSSPTWANHKGIFSAAGLELMDYPYYDPATRGLDFEGMEAALKEVPRDDVVLLHVACHNPTGVDPTPEQWSSLAALAAKQGWVPFLDFAYQGFDRGLEEDASPLAAFLEQGVEFFVASSFSKNFGLYQDRTGALTVVCPDDETADAAFSHLKRTVRVNYSNPPAHGGHIVNTVLGDEALRGEWIGELAAMRTRIHETRQAFVEGLSARGVAQDFSYITQQKGMFSFSGLTDEQVGHLREANGIYIVKGGRINVAGITPGNIDYLCDAVAAVL